MAGRVTLPILDARIDARANETRRAHSWWPCAKGCDLCCRSLPHLPTITGAEWERLRDAIDALSPDVRRAVEERLDASADAPLPVTCPLLDASVGACLVYAARPIACRTYGFYTERDAGLHCTEVLRQVDTNDAGSSVVWGNGEGIAADMSEFGAARSLRDWWRGRAPLREGA
jgi:Fe-S-cluster containining protein